MARRPAPRPTLPPGDPLPVGTVAATLAAAWRLEPAPTEAWLRRLIEAGTLIPVRVLGTVHLRRGEAETLLHGGRPPRSHVG